MPTITRPEPDSKWDFVAHVAADIFQTAKAHLNNRYAFKFSNISPRTVKIHLQEDPDDGRPVPPPYVLSVPVNSEGVEVAMGTRRLRARAGFYDPGRDAYEIFWEGRCFLYEPGITITVAARHSVDSNRWFADVTPGAPLALRGTAAVAAGKEFLGSVLVSPCLLGQAGVQMFSLHRGNWVGGGQAMPLADGCVELAGSSGSVKVDPRVDASLVRLPPSDDSSGSTVGSQAESLVDAPLQRLRTTLDSQADARAEAALALARPPAGQKGSVPTCDSQESARESARTRRSFELTFKYSVEQ